ncbi:MAG: heparinase II/III family protein [Sedimentisphaeraceae bacterium JB056]
MAVDDRMRTVSQSIISDAQNIDISTLPVDDFNWWNSPDAYASDEYMAVRFMLMEYSNAARNSAYGWMLSDDSSLAEKSKAILLLLSEFRFEYYDVNSGIDYSSATLPALQAYELVYDFFDQSEHSKMALFFDNALLSIKKCNDYWMQYHPAGSTMSNHEGWHNVFFAMYGFFYDDQEMIYRAIEGVGGFKAMLRDGFQDDGVWLEGSLGYHMVQLTTMTYIADMSYNCGYIDNLYVYSEQGRSFVDTYANTISLLFPDGMIPSIGDNYGNLRYLKTYPEIELIHTRTGDQRFAYLINQNSVRNSKALLWGLPVIPQDVSAVGIGSKLWPEHGFAALRLKTDSDYWNGEYDTVFTTFSNNVAHSHADGLSLMLYGKGHLWLRDSECKNAGTNTFGSDVNQNLNWTTISHNTILIDESNQVRNPEPLDLLEFSDFSGTKKIRIADLNGHLYSGVRQCRTVFLNDDYVLDVFEINSDGQHKISWITHIDGESNSMSYNIWQENQWPEEMPWSFLNGKSVSMMPSVSFWESFVNSDKYMRMDVKVNQSATCVKTQYPVTEIEPVAYIPMRLFEVNGSYAVYAVVYRTDNSPITSDANITINDSDVENVIITVEINGIESSFDLSQPLVECGSAGVLDTDLNKDCYVDIQDFMILAASWMKSTI